MNISRKKKIIITLFAFIFPFIVDASNLSIAEQKRQFINDMVQHHGFDKKKLESIFTKLHKDDHIINQVTTPFEKVSWGRYKSFFLTPTRIHLGASYLNLHHEILQKVAKQYGIPPEIIVAIIGVETAYGFHLGGHPIANTLYTLAFYYPKRQSYFKSELKSYFILARQNHLETLKLTGSYAGALGIPQFMPSSYLNYGVAALKHKTIDLIHRQSDAIASVANYFSKNGWERGMPIAEKISNNKTSGNLLTFMIGKKKVFWRTHHNFDVIMRYNHSPNYAMVVYQLAQAIQKQYDITKYQKRSNTIT